MLHVCFAQVTLGVSDQRVILRATRTAWDLANVRFRDDFAINSLKEPLMTLQEKLGVSAQISVSRSISPSTNFVKVGREKHIP
jgi:hypothetical protein